ncbi:MAG: Mur ligase family protein [Ktedonobacterales bacterium]
MTTDDNMTTTHGSGMTTHTPIEQHLAASGAHKRPLSRRERTHARAVAAVFAGRASGALVRRLRIGGGTSLPGLIAQYADPRLISHLGAQLHHGSVVITGTNGKTTTSGLTAYVLRETGLRIWRNREGSNLARGVATALLMRARPNGRLREHGDAACVFEVDEAAFPRVVAELQPRAIVVTNLFRDQLDRYGEVDTVAEKWRTTLRRLPDTTTLILNADDPAVAALADSHQGPTVFFGVEQAPSAGERSRDSDVVDTRTCARCRAPLTFSRRFYSHIGHWACPNCGYARPTPTIAAKTVLAAGLEEARFVLATPAGEREERVGLPGLYNVYNALAAAAVGTVMGADLAAVSTGLGRFTPAFGRAERIEAEGRTVHLLLAKNPTGLNEVMRALAANTTAGPQRHLLMLLNDRAADGEDVSWIWDADFEQIAGTTKHLTAGGMRAYDLALRLKYAGAVPDSVEPEIATALTQAIQATPVGETLFVIPTYTAMLAVRGELERRGFAPHYWEQEDV